MTQDAAIANKPLASTPQGARRKRQHGPTQSPTIEVETMETMNDVITRMPGTADDGQVSSRAAGSNSAKPEADPFDLNSLRLSQDFASAVGVKKLIMTVPVRKPSKEWFIRTHPDPDYRLPTAVLELKEDNGPRKS